MHYMYGPWRCEFFPVTRQDICPITQLDNRNSLVMHLDTRLNYQMPGCVSGKPDKLSIAEEHIHMYTYICMYDKWISLHLHSNYRVTLKGFNIASYIVCVSHNMYNSPLLNSIKFMYSIHMCYMSVGMYSNMYNMYSWHHYSLQYIMCIHISTYVRIYNYSSCKPLCNCCI